MARHFLFEKKKVKQANPCSPPSQAVTIFRIQLFLLTKAHHVSVCWLLKSLIERGMRRVLRPSLKYSANPPQFSHNWHGLRYWLEHIAWEELEMVPHLCGHGGVVIYSGYISCGVDVLRSSIFLFIIHCQLLFKQA